MAISMLSSSDVHTSSGSSKYRFIRLLRLNFSGCGSLLVTNIGDQIATSVKL
ncbi:hypothetical protein HanXRQr2_Chr14g0652461 [Helianthus annuus]|uniref:Uncharacterized protein n=1 Tax=Helianthus annuus TaxID=4232 RepID=A0A9K3EA67_HELAN|nr:hypothetical protein HanXRQr2_Chr14g0652461 [Helianthus annuus]KAJ0469428.1 hypothetical protein HanIR_Chr14g0707801 [Helianthus annuus]KAJ0841024.1 hypothetical protein HanPSC8_Chr14g0625691 [Helianthus annuus]